MILAYNTLEHRLRGFRSWDDAYDCWYHNKCAPQYLYYFVNLESNVCIPFQSKEEIKAYWVENRRWRFLNITGSDSYRDENGDLRLRPYMILNKEGQTVDIRDWDFINVDVSIIHRPAALPNWWGRRNFRHSHRKHDPAMYHNALRRHDFVWDEDNCEYRQITSPQRKRIWKGDVWYYVECSHTKDYASSKCWKDQCRANKQYNKHHPDSKPYNRHDTEFLNNFCENEDF